MHYLVTYNQSVLGSRPYDRHVIISANESDKQATALDYMKSRMPSGCKLVNVSAGAYSDTVTTMSIKKIDYLSDEVYQTLSKYIEVTGEK